MHVDRIAYSWLTRRFIDADAIIRLFGREEATGITSLIAGVVDGLWSECRRRRNATRVSPPSSLLPFGKSRGLQDDWSPIAPGQRHHHGHYPWQHEQNSGRPWVMCISQPIEIAIAESLDGQQREVVERKRKPCLADPAEPRAANEGGVHDSSFAASPCLESSFTAVLSNDTKVSPPNQVPS